jgi:hypothetical protein
MCNPTLKHILNGCYVFLRQGRFTWRHNNVLKDITPGLKRKHQTYTLLNHLVLAMVYPTFSMFLKHKLAAANSTNHLCLRDVHYAVGCCMMRMIGRFWPTGFLQIIAFH